MRTRSSSPIKPRNPEMAALLGGVCIGAGMVYIRMKKTAAACIVLALLLVGIWFYHHILWTLQLLAVLWYWQVQHGYDKAEDFNTSLVVEGKPPWQSDLIARLGQDLIPVQRAGNMGGS